MCDKETVSKGPARLCNSCIIKLWNSGCKICVDGEIFSQFIELNLLPLLLPLNGSNPNSIVVMDNASVHYNSKVAELIQSVGALLVYLPPYNPDLRKLFLRLSSFSKQMRR